MKLARNQGFTILEVTIVMALFAFLLAGMFGFYFQINDLMKTQHEESINNGQALQAMTTLSNDMNNIFFESWNDRQNFVITKQVKDNKRIDFLHFPTATMYSNPGTMQSGVRSVTYYAEDDPEKDIMVLYRKEDIFVTEKDKNEGIAVPLLSGIELLEVQFSMTGTDWFDEWDYAIRKNLPRYIKVNFGWKEGENVKKFTFHVRPPLLWN